MQNFKKLCLCKAMLLLTLAGCIEPYDPPEVAEAPSFLVVDGFVDATSQHVRVRLSRTVALASSQQPPAEQQASVSLEDERGATVPLTQTTPGLYEAFNLNLNLQIKYRLKITSQGDIFMSDYIELKETPPIQSVGYDIRNEGVNINVSTEDPTGKSKYYRWRYVETFEYTTSFTSIYKIEGGEVVLRSPDEYLYRCWRTDNSNRILIGSSERLTSDAIKNFTLFQIPKGSRLLNLRYSILVEQQALSEQAYTYYLNLYKTTENVGGLFDPMPGQVIGNIKNLTKPNEFVIGFFSGATTVTKRTFISRADLPNGYTLSRLANCELDTLFLDQIPDAPVSTLLISEVYSLGIGPPVLLGYSRSSPLCADCRLGGGVTTKPDFW